jgi:hypothetical protein
MKRNISLRIFRVCPVVLLSVVLLTVSGCDYIPNQLAVQLISLMQGDETPQEEVSPDETAQEDSMSEQGEDDPLQTKSFGSYILPDGWIEAEQYSHDEKYFYIRETSMGDSVPTNISVEMGVNRYSINEHLIFRRAILDQLIMQAQNAESVNGSGTYTEKDYPLYIFTINDEDATTVQYYIVGEKKYILVHLTVYDDEETEIGETAALHIVNSFIWPE